MFEVDEAKRRVNIQKHGVDLLEAAEIFAGYFISRIDRRTDYGEVRFAALGYVGQTAYIVIYTQRGDKIRLISARKAGRKDLERYKDFFAG
jgi:uncharacterized protein